MKGSRPKVLQEPDQEAERTFGLRPQILGRSAVGLKVSSALEVAFQLTGGTQRDANAAHPLCPSAEPVSFSEVGGDRDRRPPNLRRELPMTPRRKAVREPVGGTGHLSSNLPSVQRFEALHRQSLAAPTPSSVLIPAQAVPLSCRVGEIQPGSARFPHPAARFSLSAARSPFPAARLSLPAAPFPFPVPRCSRA